MQRIDREHAVAVRRDRSPIGETCRCRRDRRAGPHLARRETGKLREEVAAPLADSRPPARPRDRRNRRTGSTRRIPAPGTASECPASAEISGHRAKAARARQRVTALLRCRNWRSGHGSAERRRSFRREVERRRAARVSSATGSAGPDRGSRVWQRRRIRSAAAVIASNRPRYDRSARPSRCDENRRSTRRRAHSRRARAGAAALPPAARSRRRQRFCGPRPPPHLPDDGGEDMVFRLVEDLLCRVQPQPVEMVFVDPIAGIGEEKIAHRSGIGAIEIDRLAPFVGVAVGQISRRERFEIVPVRAEMVVDDVEDDRDAECMRRSTKRRKSSGGP